MKKSRIKLPISRSNSLSINPFGMKKRKNMRIFSIKEQTKIRRWWIIGFQLTPIMTKIVYKDNGPTTVYLNVYLLMPICLITHTRTINLCLGIKVVIPWSMFLQVLFLLYKWMTWRKKKEITSNHDASENVFLASDWLCWF